MAGLSRIVMKVEMWLVALPAMLALALVAEQAVLRHLYPAGLVDWAEEITVYLVMWSVFFSLGQVSAKGTHIRTELLLDKLPEGWRRVLEAASAVLALGFMAWLAWYGWDVAHQAMIYDDRTSSSLRFPIWIYYAILPIGCVGMAVGFLIQFLRLLRGGPAGGHGA